MEKKKNPPEKFTVLRDTGEHKGYGWVFKEDDRCAGTVERNLYTGDYSLDGYYHNNVFVIERKGSVAELVKNISQKEPWDDFKQELERLEEFRHPFVVCEFPFSLLMSYPVGSSIPRHLWKKIRVTPDFLLKRMLEIELRFRTKFIFTDTQSLGKEVAYSLFKRVFEHARPKNEEHEEPPGREEAADD